MNESKLKNGARLSGLDGTRLPYRIALVLLILGAVIIPQAFAVEDMWTAANRIIKDVYSKLAAISTVLAGLMSAIAVIGAKMSGAQPKADQASGLAQAHLARVGHHQRYRRVYRLRPPAVRRSGNAGIRVSAATSGSRSVRLRTR